MGKIQIDFINAVGSPRLTLACGFVIVEFPAALTDTTSKSKYDISQ